MNWEQYKIGKEIKGRSSKKARSEHEKALFAAWFNLHGKHQKSLSNQIDNILNKKP